MVRLILMVLVSTLLTHVVFAQDAVAPDNNLTEACVTDFDPSVDYFPDKITVTAADKFTVDYFNHYKVVTVTGSMETYTYVLVQCGTPAPEADEFVDGAQFIEVPAGNIITLSTTHLPALVELDLLDNLVGVDSLLYTSNPAVRERIDADEIIEVAPNFELNMELVLDVEPTLVMSDDFDTERLARLIDTGIPAVVNVEYLELTPSGRAEWLKFIALFYNAEAAAEERFDEIVTAYERVADLVVDVPESAYPRVLWNAPFNGQWGIPGGQTFAGQLLADAGATLVLSDPESDVVSFVSLETVYEAGLDADVWLLNLFNVSTVDDLIAQDERYADFAAAQSGDLWNNDADVNENFGNNYYELGVTSPHLILEDLVAIFHPDLLPDHEFHFFRQLDAPD